MKQIKEFIIPVLFTVAISMSGCSRNGDDNSNGAVITSVFPASAGGGDTITVLGQNLPTDISSIRVSVNDKRALIITATADSIKLIVPELAGSGKVVVTAGGSTVNGPVFSYVYEAIVTTIAGTGAVGSSDGPGQGASFNNPWGIAIDADNNLFIADSYNRLIRKISGSNSVSTFPIPVLIGTANFYSPYNLAIDPVSKNIYVTDFNEHVMRMDPSGNMSVIYQGDSTLSGIAVSPDSKSLYITNNTTGKIIKTDIDGTNASVFTAGIITPRNILFNNGRMYVGAAPQPVYEVGPNGEPAAAVASISGYQGWEFTIDNSGNFYLADHFNNCIRMIEKNKHAFILAGSGDPADIDGTGLQASFDGPKGITIDSQGNLYVTTFNDDTNGGNKVRKIVIR